MEPKSIVDDLGREVVAIISPVSVCMLLVVMLVRGLTPHGASDYGPAIGTLVYREQSTDSDVQKLEGALLNAAVFIFAIAVVTFGLVGCFYLRCMKLIWGYMAFSGFTILAWLGGSVAVQIIQALSIPIDVITFSIILYNFAVVGVLAVFFARMPIFITQGYLVAIGAVVAFWFSHLPEWTTWLLLIAMAIYDLVAVLVPGGPLKMLVEMAQERDEDIPALIYEARPSSTFRPPPPANAYLPDPLATGSPPTSPRLNSLLPEPPPRLYRPRGWTSIQPTTSAAGSAGSDAEDSRREVSLQRYSSRPGGRGTATQHISGPAEHDQEQSAGSREESTATEVENGDNGDLGLDGVQERQPLIGADASSSGAGRGEGVHGPSEAKERIGNTGAPSSSRVRQSAGVSPLVVDLSDAVTEGGDSGEEGRGRSGDREFALPDAIKLGLGDFIFYSVLVGRAAMFDLMTVFACYLAIIAGLGATLVLLAVFQKALPALPISIALGVLFYLLTRLLMDPFVVGLATKLIFI